jgi:hypothetical protein
VAVARLAHRGARFATRAALEDARCDSRVGGKSYNFPGKNYY